MAVSNKFSRARRSGVVITSTIALALGGAAIVAPSTAAAEGVRYTGTQEPVAPKVSELNSTALTCGVQLTDTVSSNSGLRYERRVPNKANPTDPIFGLQVTADTSGERTFNYLNVLDGPNNPPISGRTVTLPPLQPGDTIGPPATGTVNYVDGVPDMGIEQAGRFIPSRKVEALMDLTEGQVDQIANGGMTIGWMGRYNDGMKQGDSFFFSDSGEFLVNGVVNPWPSENADCSPITIEWADQLDTDEDNYEATVINPGERVKVGTVSADDDSLERLRFTAKDPKGNVVPGEITRDGNDIYWTMADYLDGSAKYTKTDEITFEMIALPRDLAGLQKAAKENGSLPETVYESSLAPERYRSAETIATKTFDIDDAKNHDPNYDSRQQNITSGVADNAPTEGRQTRTFTNVADSNGDTLTDLVNKYNAEIELDDSNVYEGWDAYFRDPANGDYTVVVESPAGTDARPGSFAQPIVKVTYSNGTQDIIPLLVIVDPNNTQTTDVVYPPATIRGLIGEEMKSAAPTLRRVIGKNQKPVTPASYAVDPATVPAGWTIEVAPDGTVTATSPSDAKAGDIARPTIVATYPDGTVDEREVTFLVGDDASLNDPSYPVEVTKAGAPVTHQIQDAPEGVTFTLDNDEVDGWTYSIEPTTGAVTVTPPAGAKGGDKKTNTVTVTYPDGTTDTVPVDTVVAHSFNYEAEPHYPQETAYPGEQITSPLSVDKPDEVGYATENPFAIVPGEGFTATGENNEFGNPIYTVNTPNGDWTVSLDNDGNVISKIPETAKKGDSVSVPVKVTYEDNSTDETTALITVEDNPTRKLPFDVEYKYDPTLPAGTYEVETEGVAGVEKQQRDGTWKRASDPINEVVRVGTKQATADLNWTEPIPYSTTTRANPELAPGETKVVQKGVNGERVHTAKVSSEGDQLDVTQTETTKDPVEEIIEYGPRLKDQQLVTETKRKIPFETKITYDDTLPAGTQVVDEQGVVGEEKVTSTQKLVDGKPAGDPVVKTTIVTQKQDAVIRVGTKTEGLNTVEHTEPVPFETKVEYDPNVPAGTYEVVTPGKAGEKTVTVSQTIVNSQVTETKREENVTTQPVAEVIKVGTKQATATDKVEWTEPIPFSTVVRPNPDLKPGEVKTVQEGSNGRASYAATFEGTNGTAKVIEVKARTEPTDRIIEYGPTIADQTLTSTTTNPVPFNTTFVADPTLAAGEQVVDKQGENGVDTVTATQEIKDGKPVGEPKVTTERTKEPVDAVVRVGTKTEGQTVNTYQAEIPFPVRVVYDPDLAPGESKVTQEGKPGTKKVTITQPVVNSAPNGEATVAEETVTEPTEQIVTVGTKPDEATNTATWTVDVPFKTVVRPNTDLKPGEVKTVQEGEYGEKTYTADFSSVGSDSKVETKEEQTKAPKDQIIEYGPTIDDQTLTSTTTRPIAFETEFVVDDTLPAGTQQVDRQGENGVETITSTQEIKDGQPVGEPSIGTEQTKAPTNAVIRVGTMTNGTHELTEKQPIPFDTKIEYDSAIPAGEYQVVTEGKVGEKTTTITQTIVNSKVTETERGEEKVTTEPVTQVIKVGTKQATASEDVTWTEPIPYPTVLRANGDLAPGEIKVVQEGVDGEATYTASFTGTNGEAAVEETKQRTEPVEKIVEYGPRLEAQELVTETEKPVPFDTKIVFDDTLAAGEQVVDTQGEYGTDVVTSTQKLVDGKPSGDPVVTTERTKEPVNAVIRVGTKTGDTRVVEEKVSVPFETVIEYDPAIPAGEYKVAAEGVPGEKIVTVTQTIVNSQVTDTKRDETITTAPQPRIIKVGTKQPEAGANVTWTEPIPFTTEFRENPDLAPGETKVVQEGKDGEATYYVEFKTNGESATVENTNQRVEPVNRIVEYGPRANDDEISTQLTRPIEFKTSVIYDDTLEEGKQVITQGELGEEIVTTTQKLVDGAPSGDPVTTTQVTKAPVNAVIRIGTKKPDAPAPQPEISETVDLPFTTKIVYDPTLEPGQEIEDVAGENGQVKVTVVNGRATVETVKEPVQRVVRVGTKPAGDVEWTEEIPFKVVVRENPELTREQSRIAQEGVPGLKQVVNGKEQIVREPVDYILEVGTKATVAKPEYSLVTLQPGQTANIQPANAVKGNQYRKLDWPRGWEGTVDAETGEVRVITPADAKPGTEVELPVEVTDVNGVKSTVHAKVKVMDKDVVPTPNKQGSSDKAKRCLENAFAANSPFLWLLPIALLGAVGYGVNEAFGPQIQQVSAQINEQVRRNIPDFGIGHGFEQPEWMRQINAQVDAINRQFAPVAKQLEPLGIALGAIAAISLTGVLIAQACTEEGFDNGMTVLGSSKS